MPHSITIVLHGDSETALPEVEAAIRAYIPRERLKRIALAWDAPEPQDMVWRALHALWTAASTLQTMDPGCSAEKAADTRQALDEAILRAQIALAAGTAKFVPTDGQVLWAANYVGQQRTSTGHPLEDLLPAGELTEFVRRIVRQAQSHAPETEQYPDDGALMRAARSDGLIGNNYGDVIFEGAPLEQAGSELINLVTGMLPPDAKLVGFGPTAYRGLQVDYVKPDGGRGSIFQMGVRAKVREEPNGESSDEAG